MCRLYAHWGQPARVADLVVRPSHSLLRQCTDAREQSSGCENPDGWGVGWWVDGDDTPHRYRSATPMPDDTEGLTRLDALVAGRFVAHVRHKSPGLPVEVTGNAPFVSGRWLFAHNGFVDGYRDGVDQELLDQLSPARRDGLEGHADSEVIFGLVLDRLDAGAEPAIALADVLEPLTHIGGNYNVVLTDGEQLLATSLGNSLYVRRRDAGRTGDEIASEPYDDGPGWTPLRRGTLVEFGDDNGSETSELFEGAYQ